jgi:alpha-tubulin suppressor-like RCC1 family protein
MLKKTISIIMTVILAVALSSCKGGRTDVTITSSPRPAVSNSPSQTDGEPAESPATETNTPPPISSGAETAREYTTLSAGNWYVAGVSEYNVVKIAGYTKAGLGDAAGWQNIVSIAGGGVRTIGLKSDGTVITAGRETDTSDWGGGYIAVVSGYDYVVGLKNDGTLTATGHNGDKQLEVSDWSEVTAVAVGWRHTVGLHPNGTVSFTGYSPNKERETVINWSDIKFIAAGGGVHIGDVPTGHTLGVTSGGELLAAGMNAYGQCNVNQINTEIRQRNAELAEPIEIVGVAAGLRHSVVLLSDGTVLAVGHEGDDVYSNPCDVGEWIDIVAITAGGDFTAGLKSDGSVVFTGSNNQGQRDAERWADIKLP